MAYRPIGLCGMGKERPKGKGLEGGHTLQAKEMSRLVAPFRARYYCPDDPRPHRPPACAPWGLSNSRPLALCRPSTCLETMDATIAINDFTACPNAENRSAGVCCLVEAIVLASRAHADGLDKVDFSDYLLLYKY